MLELTNLIGFGISGDVPVQGQQLFTGSGSFVVPYVNSICVVCIGKGGTAIPSSTGTGGSGGGALSYTNDIAVTPGETLTVVSNSTFTALLRSSTELVKAENGRSGTVGSGGISLGGGGGRSSQGVGTVRRSGGNGGAGTGDVEAFPSGGGGGGAAGYFGSGGDGGGVTGGVPTAGYGGGGGGAQTVLTGVKWPGAGGGGVGVLGDTGSLGIAGTNGTGGAPQGGGGAYGGGDGSDSVSGGNFGRPGGQYGGGRGGNADYSFSLDGQLGAVRIIWGVGRSYPSNAGDV